MATLLRIATAGSVDDGKSTLIGRLLYRLQGRHGGSARRGRAHLQGTRTRLHRSGVGDRRPACRTRARHHDRRRLPLLRHLQAEIHHRRHSRPHPVHPQHGDRHVDRATGDRVGRRPPRPARAVAQARLPGLAARHPAHRARGQQDGPRRLGSGAFREDPRRLPRVRRAPRHPRRDDHSAVGAQRRQRGNQIRRHAVVRRARAAVAPRGRVYRRRSQPRRRAFPRAIRDQAADPRARRPPQLCRHRRQRRDAPRRRGRRPAHREDEPHHRRSRGPAGRCRKPSRRWRCRSAWPTTSTSRAAT